MRRAVLPRLSGALAAALWLSPPAWSQVSGSPLFGPEESFSAPDGPGPGSWVKAPPEGAVADDNPTASEKSHFWESLEEKAQDICQKADISLGRSEEVADVLKIKGEVERSLARFPDGGVALVDRFRPAVSVSLPGYVYELGDGAAGALGFSLGLNASVAGDSIVIRRTRRSSCRSLLRALDPLDYKTVFPVASRRFGEMAVGELWKASVRWQISVAPTVSASYEAATLSLGLSKGREQAESLTLYRLSEDKLRLRLRWDRADVHGVKGSLSASFKAAELGLAIAEDRLADAIGGALGGVAERAANRLIARQINKILKATIELSHHSRGGHQSLIEFILDPRDGEQMKALSRLIRGDLLSLEALQELVRPARRTPEELREGLERLAESRRRALGLTPVFAGTEAFERATRRFNLVLPVLWEHRGAWTGGAETILLPEGKTLRVFPAERKSSDSLLNIPFVGKVTAHESWRSVQVLAGSGASGPSFLYVQQEGLHREYSRTARETIQRADAVARYAGTRGRGTNPRTRLPVDELVPPRLDPPSHGSDYPSTSGPIYRKGTTALSLIFTEKAVRAILRASPWELARAFANSLLDGKERYLFSAVLSLPTTRIAQDGKIAYDASPVLKGMVRDLRESAATRIAWLARDAARVIADVASVRWASPETQGETLRDVLAGKGKSGLAYEDIVRVFIQLADPADLAGEFWVRIRKKVDGEKDLNERFVLNRRSEDDGALQAMLAARRRFQEPSRLSD